MTECEHNEQEELPLIQFAKRKVIAGHEVESIEMCVKGKTLDECRKHFDTIMKENTE